MDGHGQLRGKVRVLCLRPRLRPSRGGRESTAVHRQDQTKHAAEQRDVSRATNGRHRSMEHKTEHETCNRALLVEQANG